MNFILYCRVLKPNYIKIQLYKLKLIRKATNCINWNNNGIPTPLIAKSVYVVHKFILESTIGNPQQGQYYTFSILVSISLELEN